VTDTGVVNDANPTSSDAILAQSQTLVLMAEQLNNSNGDSLKMIAQMAQELTEATLGQRLVNHEKLAENVYASTFADGSVVYVNYGSKAVSVKGIRIPAMDFVREEAQK
jgi:hypothetical protein